MGQRHAVHAPERVVLGLSPDFFRAEWCTRYSLSSPSLVYLYIVRGSGAGSWIDKQVVEPGTCFGAVKFGKSRLCAGTTYKLRWYAHEGRMSRCYAESATFPVLSLDDLVDGATPRKAKQDTAILKTAERDRKRKHEIEKELAAHGIPINDRISCKVRAMTGAEIRDREDTARRIAIEDELAEAGIRVNPSVSCSLSHGRPTRAESKVLRRYFDEINVSGSGHIDWKELLGFLVKQGTAITSSQLKAMIAEADLNHDGRISFVEFFEIVARAADNQAHNSAVDGWADLRARIVKEIDGECTARPSKREIHAAGYKPGDWIVFGRLGNPRYGSSAVVVSTEPCAHGTEALLTIEFGDGLCRVVREGDVAPGATASGRVQVATLSGR